MINLRISIPGQAIQTLPGPECLGSVSIWYARKGLWPAEGRPSSSITPLIISLLNKEHVYGSVVIRRSRVPITGDCHNPLRRLFSPLRGRRDIQSQNLVSGHILHWGEHIGDTSQDTSVVNVYDIAQRRRLVQRFRDDETEVDVSGIHNGMLVQLNSNIYSAAA